MASKFALEVAERHLETTKTIGAQRLADNVDAELQEVREVLNDLRTAFSTCWCIMSRSATGEHEPTCQRAHALMEKLEVK